jgi:transposase
MYSLIWWSLMWRPGKHRSPSLPRRINSLAQAYPTTSGLEKARRRWCQDYGRLAVADGGYQEAATATAVREDAGLPLEIVKRSDAAKGFLVLPRRWIVERTFGWLGRCRRLAKDYENRTRTTAAFLVMALIRLMLRRIARALMRSQNYEDGLLRKFSASASVQPASQLPISSRDRQTAFGSAISTGRRSSGISRMRSCSTTIC